MQAKWWRNGMAHATAITTKSMAYSNFCTFNLDFADIYLYSNIAKYFPENCKFAGKGKRQGIGNSTDDGAMLRSGGAKDGPVGFHTLSIRD